MPPCVLVGDHHPTTRAAVVEPLLQAGYQVVAYDSPMQLLAHLRTAATPHIAIVSRNQEAHLGLDRSFLAVRADAELSSRHRYICSPYARPTPR